MWVGKDKNQVVVLNICYFHPYLGKISNSTNILNWVETTKQNEIEHGPLFFVFACSTACIGIFSVPTCWLIV